MTALVLLAHGSRHPGAAEAVGRLAAAAGAAAPAGCAGPSRILVAWLDLAEPSLDDVLAGLAAAGERRAVVVPLLFTEAFHARVDVPEQVRRARRHGVEVHVTRGLGLGEGVRRAMLRSAAAACTASAAPRSGALLRPGAARDVLVMAVGSSDPAANDAVRAFAGRLGAGLPARASAAFAVAADGPRGADAVAAAARVAARRGRDLVVAPLFAAPGLLWDRVAGDGRGYACDVAFGEPLAERLAGVVADRWDSAPRPVRGCPAAVAV